MQPGIPRFFGKPELKTKPVALPLDDTFADAREFVGRDLIAAAKKAEADWREPNG